jgi:opacity protein-like surface antigen
MSINYARMASAIVLAVSSTVTLAAVPSQEFLKGFYVGINSGASFVTGQTFSDLDRGPDFLTAINNGIGIQLPTGFADGTNYRDEASSRGYNSGIFIGWDFYCDREYIYGVEISGNLYTNRAYQTWWNIGIDGIINFQDSWDLTYSADVVFKPGWFVSDSTKLYAILGLSIAGLNTELKNLAVNNQSDNVSLRDDNQTIWGFVLGAGIQKQLCNHFSAFASYQYTYYGRTELDTFAVESDQIQTDNETGDIVFDASSSVQNRELRIDSNVFKLGLIYSF